MEKCFAMKKNGCSALLGNCPGYDKCPFYKSKKQAIHDKQATFEYLRSLPFADQQYFAEKYYKGKMPGANEAE